MDVGTLLESLARDPIFYTIYLLLVLSFANFVIGSAKAGLGNFFEGEVWGAWVAKDAKRIAPIIFGLLFSKALGDVTIIPGVSAGTLFGAYALAQAASVVVSLSDSIKEKLLPNPSLKRKKAVAAKSAHEDIPDPA